MEELTKTQVKYKQKLELISRLVDQKTITFEEGLLLLSNTEEVVKPSIPSYPVYRSGLPGMEPPYKVTCESKGSPFNYKMELPTNNID